MRKNSINLLPSQSSIFVSSRLPCLLSLDVGGLVVPMLEVLVDSSFLRRGIFISQGRKSITINALAMHGLVESCISLPVFGLESDGGRHVWKAGVRWKFEDQLTTLKVLGSNEGVTKPDDGSYEHGKDRCPKKMLVGR